MWNVSTLLDGCELMVKGCLVVVVSDMLAAVMQAVTLTIPGGKCTVQQSKHTAPPCA